MLERVLIKLVFCNNFTKTSDKIDVFSLPIISTILTPNNPAHQGYLRYERAYDFPDSLRNTYEREGLQFELFEFAYRPSGDSSAANFKADEDASGAAFLPSPDTPKKSRKRKSTNTPATAIGGDNADFESFKKEVTWSIFQNYRLLSEVSSDTSRCCFLNVINSKQNATVSRVPLYAENTMGYMRVFSSRAKKAYLTSLNYRNSLSLLNHYIMFFDVEKYHLWNSSQIFRMSDDSASGTNINILVKIAAENEERKELQNIQEYLCDHNISEEDKFTFAQNLLCNEVMPPDDDSHHDFILTPDSENSLANSEDFLSLFDF